MTICFATRADRMVLDGDDHAPSTPQVAQPNAPTADTSVPTHRSGRPDLRGGSTMRIASLARLVAAIAAGVLASGGHALAQT